MLYRDLNLPSFRDRQWEDRSSGSQYRGTLAVVWSHASDDEEVVDWPDLLKVLRLFDTFHSV